MARVYVDTEVTETATFRNSSNVLVDPDNVTFQYRQPGYTDWISVTPTSSTTGVYTATYTPEYPSFVHFEWKATGNPKVTIQDTRFIERTAFNKGFNSDYRDNW